MAAYHGLGLSGRLRVLPDPLPVKLDELAAESMAAVVLEDDEAAELVVPVAARDADRAHGRERRRQAQQDVRGGRVEAWMWRVSDGAGNGGRAGRGLRVELVLEREALLAVEDLDAEVVALLQQLVSVW